MEEMCQALFYVVLRFRDVGIRAVMVFRVVRVVASDVVVMAPCVLGRRRVTSSTISGDDVIQGNTPLYSAMVENRLMRFASWYSLFVFPTVFRRREVSAQLILVLSLR